MRCPVDTVVAGESFGASAIKVHAPDLHGPGAVGVEVDNVAVCGDVRIVRDARARGQGALARAIEMN